MINSLYVNNFRSLVAFKTTFSSFGVLCGPNGAGKSSVFDAVALIRNLATGDAILGGLGAQDVASLDFSKWHKSRVQEFEIEVKCDDRQFSYVIHLEQTVDFEKPRVIKERATCDGRSLFERDLDGVSFTRQDGTSAKFPLDWRQAALASIQPKGPLAELQLLKNAMADLLILRPNPRSMERESKAELLRPDLYLTGLTSWYRSLSQNFEWTFALHKLLNDIWPDFKSLKLVDVGLNAKAMVLRFDGKDGDDSGELSFDKLSDGERALVGLYMIRAAVDVGAVQTVLIDEPDNYVGLPELQPWVLSVRELLDEKHQVILITHHPEVLTSAGQVNSHYLWRDNHTSPTRIGSLDVPEGMDLAEALARGWVK